MRTRVLLVAALLALASGAFSDGVAAPIPDYLAGQHGGAICGVLNNAGLGPISVLVQLNFDPAMHGGIDLATADSLFDQLVAALPVLGAILGPDLEIACAYNPSEMQAAFGLDALALAQQASAAYGDFGFSLYVILNVYNWVEPPFLGDAATLRADAFLAAGDNDVMYLGSASLLRGLLLP